MYVITLELIKNVAREIQANVVHFISTLCDVLSTGSCFIIMSVIERQPPKSTLDRLQKEKLDFYNKTTLKAQEPFKGFPPDE